METPPKTKKVWKAPEMEIINSKMTQGGPMPWCAEAGNYWDNNECGYYS